MCPFAIDVLDGRGHKHATCEFTTPGKQSQGPGAARAGRITETPRRQHTGLGMSSCLAGSSHVAGIC